MTTHRRYYFTHPGILSTGHEAASSVLAKACERFWWFNEPEVEGAPFQRLSFSFTVSGRDQWWCHRRAMGLAQRVYAYALHLGPGVIPEPAWETLEREGGRYQVPASPWGS